MDKFLTAADLCIQRDGHGELLPIESNLKDFNGEIIGKFSFIPLTKGELQKLMSDVKQILAVKDEKAQRDIDEEVLIKYCRVPKFDEKSVKDIKPAFINNMVKTIIATSAGVSESAIDETNKYGVELGYDEEIKKKD